MPLRLYECVAGHSHETLYAGGYPKEVDCPTCGLAAHYRFSAPTFFMAGARAPIDTAEEAWGGTGIDTDGINQTTYRSSKETVDFGEARPPPTTRPSDPVDKMLGISRRSA